MSAPDTIDAAFVEHDATALAVRDDAPIAAPALFGTTDPVQIVENAVRVANALKAVVVSKNLISKIQGKDYPQVEAWLTLAAMLRLTTICEWSRRVPDGWEARVYVRDANGATVGAAEAQCLSSEKSKRTWEDYALRSMAQTRATSKALRSVLGFVMVLAGYQATPSEEMPADDTPAPKQPAEKVNPLFLRAASLDVITSGTNAEMSAAFRKVVVDAGGRFTPEGAAAYLDGIEARGAKASVAGDYGPPLATDKQRRLAMALHSEIGHGDELRHAMYREWHGVDSFNQLTRDQAADVIDRLTAARDAADDGPLL